MHVTKIETLTEDLQLDDGIVIRKFCVLYDCDIGSGTKIGSRCTLGKCTIGKRCKIEDGTTICDGHVVEDEVFIGANVTLCNDRYPRTCNDDGSMLGDGDWTLEPVTICRRASIGSNTVIAPGTTIGEGAIIGCGAAVMHDVPSGATAIGSPARLMRALV